MLDTVNFNNDYYFWIKNINMKMTMYFHNTLRTIIFIYIVLYVCNQYSPDR